MSKGDAFRRNNTFTNGNGLAQQLSGNVQGRADSIPAGQYPAYSQQATMSGLQTMPSQSNWSHQQESISQHLPSHI